METPSYYSIIPAAVRYDKDLTPMAKLLYGEITALSNKGGYCFASNKYFADLYGVSERQIVRIIKNLYDKKYIVTEVVTNENGKTTGRKIYINDPCCTDKDVTPSPDKNVTSSPDKNVLLAPDKNVTHNNTSNINNTSINNKASVCKKQYAEFVKMTETEYNKLVFSYGEKNAITAIEVLDNYKGSSGKQYQSDYRAILNWVIGRLQKEGRLVPVEQKKTVYSLPDEVLETKKRMGLIL